MRYYGGKVIENVQVVPVFWNANVLFRAETTAFYDAVVTSSYFQLLAQYSTPTQVIGFGSTLPAVTGSGPTQATVTRSAIIAWTNAQFKSGALPPPSPNTFYSLHFPPGMTIDRGGSSLSCTTWCAYHDAWTYAGQKVYAGFFPDITAPSCRCWKDYHSPFNNLSTMMSHELAEAVTDPEAARACCRAPPLAWYGGQGVYDGEMADKCAWQQEVVTLTDGGAWTVQALWSNEASACSVT